MDSLEKRILQLEATVARLTQGSVTNPEAPLEDLTVSSDGYINIVEVLRKYDIRGRTEFDFHALPRVYLNSIEKECPGVTLIRHISRENRPDNIELHPLVGNEYFKNIGMPGDLSGLVKRHRAARVAFLEKEQNILTKTFRQLATELIRLDRYLF